jgi:linoleate 10R-lipoxygenase
LLYTLPDTIAKYLHHAQLSIAGIVGSISNVFESKAKHAEYHTLVKRLYELGHSTHQLANTILAIMVTSNVELTLGRIYILEH